MFYDQVGLQIRDLIQLFTARSNAAGNATCNIILELGSGDCWIQIKQERFFPLAHFITETKEIQCKRGTYTNLILSWLMCNTKVLLLMASRLDVPILPLKI